MTSPLGKDLRDHTGFSFSFKTLTNVFRKSSDDDESNDDPVPSSPTTPNEDSPLMPSEDDGEGDESAEYHLVVDQQEHNELPSNKSLILDGIKVMSIDVITQLCISIGVYLALASNAAQGYQITALQAFLPQVGVAYAFSLNFIFKMFGPKYIVARDYDSFARFTYVTLFCAFLLLPIIIGGVEPFKEGQAFTFGYVIPYFGVAYLLHVPNLYHCVLLITVKTLASTQRMRLVLASFLKVNVVTNCSFRFISYLLLTFSYHPILEVFGPNGRGGKFTLVYTWDVIVYGGFIDVLALTTRGILLTCNDFDYCLKSTLVAAIVYIPFIILVTIGNQPYVNTAMALFFVMYLPQLVLCILFLGRIYVILKRMKRDMFVLPEEEMVNNSLRGEPGFTKTFKLA